MMDVSVTALLELVRFSVQSPRTAARQILAMAIPDTARWLLFLLVVATSAVLTHIGFDLLPPEDRAFMEMAMSSPIRTAILQAGFLLLVVIGVHRVGRWQGGKGNFADSLLLVGWLQFILMCLQVTQIIALFILPPVAEIIGVLGLGLSFLLLTQFIVELHGFQSAWKVFLGILGVLFSAALAAAMVLVVIIGAGG